MGKKTEELLEQISKAVVNVAQNCIASAAASVNINIEGAETVNIDGLTINSTVSGNVDECKSTRDVDIGQIKQNVNETMKKLVSAASGIEGDTVDLVVNIGSKLDVNVVQNCVALAIASIVINLKNIKEDVVFKNVEINQRATSRVKQCIQNVQVRVGDSTKPLRRFFEEIEDKINVDGVSNDAECPLKEAKSFFEMVIVGSASAFVLVVVILGAVAYLNPVSGNKE
jgi:gas vesicle protein